MKTPDSSKDWPCTWEAHELEQLRHGMSMTFLQKLEWLEGALAFAQKLQDAPTRSLQEAQASYPVRAEHRDRA